MEHLLTILFFLPDNLNVHSRKFKYYITYLGPSKDFARKDKLSNFPIIFSYLKNKTHSQKRISFLYDGSIALVF